MPNADVLFALRTRGRQPAAELRTRLNISRPTLMRAVRAAGDEIIVRGSARRTAYAARRALRGNMAPIPLYRIDENGVAHEQGRVNLTYPDGSALELQDVIEWPLVGAEMVDGWYDGLPYPLLDMRPQGFLGRHFARENAAILQVNEDPQKWSDDDAVHALSLLGSNVPGNFILGAAAYRLWLESVQAPEPAIRDDEVGARYAELAGRSLQHGVGGSSAGGEFPKFTAVRQSCDAAGQPVGDVSHVIVKFSGNDESEGVQRWSDLLVCEHLATCVMRDELGIEAAETAIHQAFGRTFLEVIRFDRHGRHGRSGLLSLHALNAALLGANAGDWPVTVAKLDALELLAPTALETACLMWHFGRLIANTDMHEGNLSFIPSAPDVAGLRVAPAYDMVPMLYVPQRGVEVVVRNYAPQLPLPGERQNWRAAARAALVFWKMAADDPRISAGFRRVCSQNLMTLQTAAGHPAAV
jgi:DNA-binding Lrp family transcriptional regulator